MVVFQFMIHVKMYGCRQMVTGSLGEGVPVVIAIVSTVSGKFRLKMSKETLIR